MRELNAGTGPQHVHVGAPLDDESSLHAIMLSCVTGHAVWMSTSVSNCELHMLTS
jgi:hypothetical protein